MVGNINHTETTQPLVSMRGEAWLSKLRTGQLEELDAYYLEQREIFIGWAQENYELTKSEAIELLQLAIISLYENIVSGKIISLEHKLEAYLYGIAKNILARELKGQNKDLQNHHIAFQPTFEQGLNDTFREMTREVIEKMSEPGISILKLKYFHHLKLDSIGKKLKYKNKALIPSIGLRSLQLLKDRVTKRLT